ncbi:MAG: hypothetical protein OXI44_05430 [Bacteroidota bacterium]|nr:hypothetical protein [Bacteroidota bacterium]
MANPTIADALLDRLVQSAYRVQLKGDSLRKQLVEPADLDRETTMRHTHLNDKADGKHKL